ncbi:MAG: SIS domain-containing protein [Anaerolineae bacterium]|nr:SIS domain-containing protein [Anaerolineae bacterium]
MTSALAREIAEQPRVLAALWEEERTGIEKIARTVREYGPRYVVIAARGTSDNAARYGQYLFGAHNRLSVALATPSLFTLYRSPPRLEGALVFGISQSGQSPDIVAVLDEARRQGALTVAVTNDPASPLAGAAAHLLPLHAGQETSLAATKTYTAQLYALALLSARLAQDEERLLQAAALPQVVARVLAESKATAQAERYRFMSACVVIGRGYNYATAYELALKMKELTYVLAEPYSPADFLHGPVAMVERGFPVITFALSGAVAMEMRPFLAQVREREAELVVVSDQADALALAHTPLPIPAHVPEWLSPIVAIVPGQLFALGLTLAKGYDPDHPRGLRKVTLTV